MADNTQNAPASNNNVSVIDPKVVDSITATNSLTVAGSPSQIMTNLMQMSAHANGLSMQNAVVGQKQTNMIGDAATVQSLSIMQTLGTAADGQAVDVTDRSGDMSRMIDALTVNAS